MQIRSCAKWAMHQLTHREQAEDCCPDTVLMLRAWKEQFSDTKHCDWWNMTENSRLSCKHWNTPHHPGKFCWDISKVKQMTFMACTDNGVIVHTPVDIMTNGQYFLKFLKKKLLPKIQSNRLISAVLGIDLACQLSQCHICTHIMRRESETF